MKEVLLAGCRPTPLASYLKGIGVLRLISLQADQEAMGCWSNDEFKITSQYDSEGIIDFLLNKYAPTPVLSPWNGGSGFYDKDSKEAIEVLGGSRADRFAPYGESIRVARAIVSGMGLTEKPDESNKEELIIRCRASMPEAALDWIDTAVVLTGDGARYPPLLGTGGNDGRLEFSNNFMQRVCDAFDNHGLPSLESIGWLARSLFGEQTGRLVKDMAIGQFNPIATGGVNSQSGFESSSLANPWDYILMIEGAMCFASVSVKRMGEGAKGMASCPFTVHPIKSGYTSSAEGEECKAEVWMPLWQQPCRYHELHSVFGEGRVSIGRRSASNGYDFALAISHLGVERGLTDFRRYGMNVRNGRSVLAIPLGDFQVSRRRSADLLVEIDPWMLKYARRAGADEAPAAVSRSLRSLWNAAFSLCQQESPANLCSLLIALGECERQNARSIKWCKDEKKGIITPIPSIAWRWALKANDGSPEFRLAQAIASLLPNAKSSPGLPLLRMNLEPVVRKSWGAWTWSEDDGEVAWGEGGLVRSMNDIMGRRLISMQKEGEGYSDHAAVPAAMTDIRRFIEGDVDEARLESLVWGLALIDWRTSPDFAAPMEVGYPGAAYSVMREYYSDLDKDGRRTPSSSTVHALAASGAGPRALELALRGLKGMGFQIRLGECSISPERSRRLAASMLIPLDGHGHRAIQMKLMEESMEE